MKKLTIIVIFIVVTVQLFSFLIDKAAETTIAEVEPAILAHYELAEG